MRNDPLDHAETMDVSGSRRGRRADAGETTQAGLEALDVLLPGSEESASHSQPRRGRRRRTLWTLLLLLLLVLLLLWFCR